MASELLWMTPSDPFPSGEMFAAEGFVSSDDCRVSEAVAMFVDIDDSIFVCSSICFSCTVFSFSSVDILAKPFLMECLDVYLSIFVFVYIFFNDIEP